MCGILMAQKKEGYFACSQRDRLRLLRFQTHVSAVCPIILKHTLRVPSSDINYNYFLNIIYRKTIIRVKTKWVYLKTQKELRPEKIS